MGSPTEEAVRRAVHRAGATIEDVGVDHRRGHVLVAEELLHGADVVAVLQEMGGEGVAEGVAGRRLGDPGEADGGAHGLLEDRLVEVVAAVLASLAVEVGAGGGEDPLPGSLPAGVGVLAAQGTR